MILGVTVYPLTRMMPLNKKMYSASFAVLTACVAGGAIVVFVLIVDILPGRSDKAKRVINILITPFIWMGRNPLFMYVISEVFSTTVQEYIKVGDDMLDDAISKWLSSWIWDPHVAE